MIRIELDAAAMGRVRMMYSPLWELTSSLRLLVHDPHNGRHASWLGWAKRRIDADLLATLRPLIPQPYRFPDFLTPPPGPRPRSLRSELAQLAKLHPEVALDELRATGDWPPPTALGAMLSGTDPMTKMAAALERYWQLAVAPVWPRIRRLLAADLAYRADELAANGLRMLLNRLHPTISFDGRNLCIDTPRHDTLRQRDVDGVSLVPCAFAWPHAMAVACEPNPVSVSYAPHGSAALWLSRDQQAAAPLVELIGRSRASILTLLDLPVSAGQIADQTGLSLPAVSQHLAVLRSAGLVSSRRSGRTVWSTRTDLGTTLLTTGTELLP